MALKPNQQAIAYLIPQANHSTVAIAVQVSKLISDRTNILLVVYQA